MQALASCRLIQERTQLMRSLWASIHSGWGALPCLAIFAYLNHRSAWVERTTGPAPGYPWQRAICEEPGTESFPRTSAIDGPLRTPLPQHTKEAAVSPSGGRAGAVGESASRAQGMMLGSSAHLSSRHELAQARRRQGASGAVSRLTWSTPPTWMTRS